MSLFMKNEEKKNKIIPSVVTFIVMTLIFVILYFVGLSYQIPPPAARKVILIEIGTEGGGGGGGGGGNSEGVRHAAGNESVIRQLETERVSESPLIHSPDVSLPSIPVSVKKSNTSNTDNAQPVVTEPNPNPNAVYRPGMGGGRGGGTGTGTGTGEGSGRGPGFGSGEGGGRGSGFGTGEGSGRGSGVGYGTGNRGYTYMPELNVSVTGTVYVEVYVNMAGNVIDARVITSQKYPTTITDSRVQAECVAKAKTAKYKPGKEEIRIIIFK